jgi:Putative Ig domain
MAGLLIATLRSLHIAAARLAVTTKTVAGGRRDEPYAMRFAAVGGVAPYRWSCAPSLPAGLHLLAGGRLYGSPAGRARTSRIAFTVTDASGATSTRSFVLRIA